MAKLSKEELIERSKVRAYPSTTHDQARLMRNLAIWNGIWNVSALWEMGFLGWVSVVGLTTFFFFPFIMLLLCIVDYIVFVRHAKGRENELVE